MISTWFKYGLQFLFLVLLQGLVLNNVYAFDYAATYLYVMFILLLPVEYNKIVVMLLAFALGLSIDLFSSSWGVHTFSTVFLAYLRPFILRFFAPRDGYEFNSKPNWSTRGFSWFVTYASVVIFLHHFLVHLIEAFRFSELFAVFGRTFASTVFTLVLVLLAQLLTYKPDRSI